MTGSPGIYPEALIRKTSKDVSPGMPPGSLIRDMAPVRGGAGEAGPLSGNPQLLPWTGDGTPQHGWKSGALIPPEASSVFIKNVRR